MIVREEYLNWLIKLKDKHIIKVISGVRRCGKSTLFSLYKEYLLKQGVLINQIIDINFEDNKNNKLLDVNALYDYILKNISTEKMNYIFLDEIQNVKEFQKAVYVLIVYF